MKPIGMLVLVLGNQRAGKTTFITELGKNKSYRVDLLGASFAKFGWSTPLDSKMFTERLLTTTYIDKWFAVYKTSPLLVCHSVRWQQYASDGDLPQLRSLTQQAEIVKVILVAPPWSILKERVATLRPAALQTIAKTEDTYKADIAHLKGCCVRNKWDFCLRE